MNGFLERLSTLCAALAAAAVVGLALLVLASIASRLLGVYIGGLTEGAGYCMAAAGALGLAHTFLRGEHIRVDIVLGRLSSRPRAVVERLALVVTAAIALYTAGYLVRMTWLSWQYGDVSSGSDALPLWLPQLPVALGFALFALVVCGAAVASLCGRRAKQEG